MTTFIANAKEKVLVEKAVISKPVGYDAGCADFDSVVSYRQHIASLRRIQAPFLTEVDEGREMVEGVHFKVQSDFRPDISPAVPFIDIAVPIPTEQSKKEGEGIETRYNVLKSFTIPEILKANADLSYTLGKFYGYPNCCISAFCSDIMNSINAGLRNIDGSGFIPCPHHYKKIKAGEMTLDSLINKQSAYYIAAPPVSDGVEQRGKDSEDLLRPCDCKDEVDAQKLNEQGIGHNDEIVSVHPNYVLLKMGHTEIKIGMKRFKMFAEWYLQPQNINKH